jgi:hypothetical protein
VNGHISHYRVSEGADQANYASWSHWGPSEG